MRRAVTIRKTSDADAVSVRVGDKVVGMVADLGASVGDAMSGGFTHTPAFADVSRLFLDLDRAMTQGATADVDRLRAEIERQGVQVWHSVHDMRIDQRGSLTIAGGRMQFRPTDSFVMMRTGGL